MKMKNMIAAMTAVAVSAISFAAMTASAAVTEIPYTGSNVLATEDNGTDIRLNLLNIWGGNNTSDINSATVVEDNITVTFTISGLGANSTNVNTDGTPGAAYQMWLSGSVGSAGAWNPGENGNEPIAINGDGQYTVTWNFGETYDTINALIISSNINFYQYGESIDASGLSITLDKITTGVEDAPTEPQETEPQATEAPAGETTTTAGSTAAGGAATTTTAPKTTTTTTNANTGDNGIAIALAALGTAGAVAIVSKKRK